MILRLSGKTGFAAPGLACVALFAAALVSLPVVNASRHSVPRLRRRSAPEHERPGCHAFSARATHHTASLELREKLALAGAKLEDLHRALQSLAGLREFAVLNTCNRVEIYGVATTPDTVDRLQASFCAMNQMEPALFEKIRLNLRGHPTVQHLLEVAAGVDSQMIGETEILGQVKAAYAAAQARGTTGPVLNRVFQKSFQAASTCAPITAIGEGQISVASVAVDLALKIFGNLQPCHVLILGAGDIGEKTAGRSRVAAPGG